MQWKKSLAGRLCLSLLLLLLSLGAVVVTAVLELGEVSNRVQNLAVDRFPKVVQANLVIDRANEIARTMGEILLANDAVTFERGRRTIMVARGKALEHLTWLWRQGGSPSELRLLDEVDRVRADYVAAQNRFFALWEGGDHEAARTYYMQEALALQDAYVAALGALTRLHGDMTTLENEKAQRHARLAMGRLAAISLIVALLTAIIGRRLVQGITRPLASAVDIANRVAAGQLEIPASPTPDDELGQLLHALRVMARTLGEERLALSRSERMYRLLAVHASDVICLHSVDCRYTYLSPACATLLGRSPQELIGKTPEALVAPEDMPLVRAEHATLRNLGAESTYKMNFRVRHRDGSHRWVETAGRKVCDPVTGETSGIVSVMRDVTARCEADERLRESRELLAQSQDQAQLGSWWYDLDSHRLTLTDTAIQIFGGLPAGPPGRRWMLSVVHPDDRARIKASWDEAVEGVAVDIEYRLLVAGVVCWVRGRKELKRADDGRPLRILGTVQDIGAMKQKEAELLASRQLLRDLAAHHEQARESQRSHLAREIHDELGQFLSALRMDAAMLRMRFGHLDPDIAQHVGHMKQTIDLTMTVVRDVVAALRPGALNEGLVPAVEWLLGDFSRRTGIIGHLDAPDSDIELDGELATAAFRILQESLTNVGRHAQATEVSIRIACMDGQLHLRIDDNGVGFDPVAVGERRTFGLLGMRERVLVFGGSVSIDSAPQSGTTLTAILPIGTAPA